MVSLGMYNGQGLGTVRIRKKPVVGSEWLTNILNCNSPRAGAVAQMGERHTCTVDVAGSSPVSSTKRVVSQLGESSSALQDFGSSPLQP